MEEPVPNERYRVGDLLLDVGARLLSREGAVVPLPPKTFELLVELVRRAPGVARRQELIDVVWPDEVVNDEALTQRIMLLRRVLGDDPREPAIIASVPRWGYRIVAPVESLSDAESQASDSATRSGLQRAITSIRRRDRWVVAAALAVAGLAVTAALYIETGAAAGPIDSLAIEPFAAASGGDDVEVLREGLPATLTATLAQLPDLRVIAASTMARYDGSPADPERIGHDLGVRAVLTGRLSRHDEDIVIDTELVDSSDGSRLWGGRFERRLTDIFATEEEISADIAGGLRLHLTGQQRSRLVRRPTTSVEAYTLYLEGRRAWARRNEEGFGNAIAAFRAATDNDPSYALPYVGLADCFALEAAMEYGLAPPRDMMPKARSAVEKALEIDPDLAEAHASLGLVLWLYDWQRGRAEHELRRAIALSPGYATAHQWLAEMLAEEGRADEADEEIRRAEEFDPLSLVIGADRGLLAYYRRDASSAIEHYRVTLAMDPTFLQAKLGLGLAYTQQGDLERALVELREANRLSGGLPPTLSALGYAYGVAGKTSDARVTLGELLALRRQRYVSAFHVAGVYVGLGDRDAAFAWLDRACDERAGLLSAVSVWPAFDPLRGDPRFAALLRRIHPAASAPPSPS